MYVTIVIFTTIINMPPYYISRKIILTLTLHAIFDKQYVLRIKRKSHPPKETI